MSATKTESGLLKMGDAQIYYEMAGAGPPFVMIHAGVADHRQWNNEFAEFAKEFRVVRYDRRGYGKSQPVAGEFSDLGDLTALLRHLNVTRPAVVMGCSMGGETAMDFALTHPASVRALIMVGSAPSGLELDVPRPAKFAAAKQAYDAGDLDLAAEIETQIWFDGMDRTPAQVNQPMRRLAYEMNRIALSHESKELGKRLPDAPSPAAGRLAELDIPVLAIVGVQDIPYMLAAADYMVEHIRSVRKVVFEDAAHLSNMDQPDAFRRTVREFLDELAG
ncbi:MAG: alpha/beta hydrolase [Chloroflexi bacterium]|nr:alpha/beta hydrolase [Chloroflexota bacterium]